MLEPMKQDKGSRELLYTMKGNGRTPGGNPHPYGVSQSKRTPQGTPPTSPLKACPVGQPYPPKPSPGKLMTHDVRTPSPNYFGLLVEPSTELRESAALPKDNWSPTTSSVRSFAAALPRPLPLDANPEFEAFRRQADARWAGRGFALGTSHLTVNVPQVSTPSALPRPKPPPRWHTVANEASSETSAPRPSTAPRDPVTASAFVGGTGGGSSGDVDQDSVHDSAYVSSDSTRNSQASVSVSTVPRSIAGHGGVAQRSESPACTDSSVEASISSNTKKMQPSKVEDGHPRLSLPQNRPGLPSRDASSTARGAQRAETLPSSAENEPVMIPASQLQGILDSADEADFLLLDLRVSPQYAQSRIRGALNLCIPTTLLKRATFNLQKLQQTFSSSVDQDRFARWRDVKHLIVYDTSSSEKKDATSAMNMLKKFTNEGFTGNTYILKGGFNGFAASHPGLVDSEPMGNAANSLTGGPGGSGIAPVIGGVVLPSTNRAQSAFFVNIRQNIDLADGVGQMDVAIPPGLDESTLPQWLRVAASPSDRGKAVADMFLRIELAEQSRMKHAYGVFGGAAQQQHASTASAPDQAGLSDVADVRLAGLEKGGKNRYTDILPYEHARVVLHNKPQGACDYINASHVKAHRSNKRYIAAQGPLPATFDDFWSVVWDHDVRVIVMLTAESEGGQMKCHAYWKAKDYGPIRLKVLSEIKVSLDIDKYRSTSTFAGSTHGRDASSSTFAAEHRRRRANTTSTIPTSSSATDASATNPPTMSTSSSSSSFDSTPHVIVRKFAVSHTAHPFAPIREVTHLHYSAWPDFGAPARPRDLLALVELANVMQRAARPVDSTAAVRMSKTSGGAQEGQQEAEAEKRAGRGEVEWDNGVDDVNERPMLVHCSAGCGRTGTFCTVDSVVDMLKRRRAVRQQRERERQRQAKEQAAADADGDVVMNEGIHRADDGDISPRGSHAPPDAMFAGKDRLDARLHASGESASAAPPSRRPSPPLADTAWLDDDEVDLVQRTVEDFRRQRLSMVQSLRQFVLCYETVLEWIARTEGTTGVAASETAKPSDAQGSRPAGGIQGSSDTDVSAKATRARAGTVGAFSR